MTILPSISFIVEWENAKLSELDRAKSMLNVISSQASELGTPRDGMHEIIVLFDADEINKSDLEAFVIDAINPNADIDLRFEEGGDREYYDQKNFGAMLARSDWLVFIDSDVIPEENWLRDLVMARRNSNAVIIGGETYVSQETIFERAFGAFWFFPKRREGEGTYSSDRFFANNFIVERQTFIDNPFPESALVRGQCWLLAKRIVGQGHTIEICRSARVEHPAPNGGLHFFKRALIDGHDKWVMDRELASHDAHHVSTSPLGRLRSDLRTAFRNIGQKDESLELNFLGRNAARFLAITYYGLSAMGQMAAPVFPKRFRALFRV